MIKDLMQYTKLYFKKDLFQVIFHVTFRCNSRCSFCFNWKNIDSVKNNELTLDEINKISKSLPNFPWFLLSGGEPFLRDDLDEIIEIFYKNNKIKHISLPTNGLLTNKISEKVDSILKKCPNLSLNLVLSLDGLKEKHDKIRSIKGNFNKLVQTYKLLSPLRKKYPNLAVKFNTVISNTNYKELDKIIDYVKKLKADMHTIDFIRGSPRDKNASLPPKKEIQKLAKKIQDAYNYYQGYKNLKHLPFLTYMAIKIMLRYYSLIPRFLNENKQIIPCYAPTTNLVIYPYGDISYCEMLKPFANLRDYNYSYKSALRSEKAIKQKRSIYSKKCFCYHPCNQYVNILFNPIELIKSIIKND